MTAEEHPYSRYGLATCMHQHQTLDLSELTSREIISTIQSGLGKFRLRPTKHDVHEISFGYISYKELKNSPQHIKSGSPKEGIFLAPNALTTDKSAKQLFEAQEKLIQELGNADTKTLAKNYSVTMSIAPVTAKTNQGNRSQSNPRAPLAVAAFSAITSLTHLKPCFTTNLAPTAIIPDLELKDLTRFIGLFEKMLETQTNNLLTSKKKEGTDKIIRPPIFSGNYPNAPGSYSFGAAGLLGSIGEWSKEAGYIEEAKPVLESLSNQPMHLVSYDKTEVVSFDHYVVKLAQEAKLNKVVNALEHSHLWSENKRYERGKPTPKYQLFWMMSNRFLQSFTRPGFQDFLSFRAEYQPDTIHLLNQYFMASEKIDREIVESAKELGQWLNSCASISAFKSFEDRKDKREPVTNEEWEDWRKFKGKFLLELESSAFSAKSPTELLFQVIRRAGHLTSRDVPESAQIFINAVNEGQQVDLTQAQHLLLAYSRLKGKKVEQKSEFDYLLDTKETNQ